MIPLLTIADVTSWIDEKNATTSNKSSQISYTTGRLTGTLSCLFHQSVKIDTKEGPIYVGKNAFSYLSESEKTASHTDIDKLGLRILAETKLSSLVYQKTPTIFLTNEEKKAIETFLQIFGLEMKKDLPKSQTISITSVIQKKGSEIGSSTPEFILELVKNISSPHSSTPVIRLRPEIDPQKSALSEADQYLLSMPNDQEPLSIRKWIHHISRHIEDSEKKEHLMNDLLIAYEQKSRTLPKTTNGALPFHSFCEAIFEEMFGPKEGSQKHDYLTAALELGKLYTTTIRDILPKHMQEAVSFYCLIRENPNKEHRAGGGIEEHILSLEKAYRDQGEPSLFDRLKLIQKSLESQK